MSSSRASHRTQSSLASSTRPRDGDHWLLCLMMLVGILRPIQAIIRSETWGVEPTVGLLMAAFAARALVADAWIAWEQRRALR